MSKEYKQSMNIFEKEYFKTLPKTIRPKGVKVAIEDILEWQPSNETVDEIYISSVPLGERKKGYKINPLASEEAKIKSLASMGSNSDMYSAVGGTETMDIYAFTYWQYIESLVFWDGLVPTPDVIDAGHRNGVPVYGTLFFNWSTSEKDQEKVRYVLQRDAQGDYPVALKLIEIASYYGFDGYFINQETAMAADEGYGEAFRSFLLYLKRQAKASNYPVHIAWYDAMDNDGSRFHYDAVNNQNNLFVKVSEEDQEKPTDAFFMNFNWNAEKVQSTAEHLKAIGGSPFDAYAGWELQAGGYYHTAQNRQALIDSSGQLKLSLGLFIPDSVMGIAENGEDYHLEADKFWTGFGGNPAKEADDHEWSGMSRFVGDYTPLVGSGFHTSFNTGHGKAYFVEGDKLSAAPWNSRGIQDILPTWRWWIENQASAVKGRYDFDEAFSGGTSLAFEGDIHENGLSDIMLYSTECTLKHDSKLAVTLKANQNVKVEIGLGTDPSYTEESFTYYSINHSEYWHTHVINLEDLTQQTIYSLKLRLTSENKISDFKLNVGQLALYQMESNTYAPAHCEIVKSILFNAQEAEAILRITPVKSAKLYEVYQKTGDSWTYLNASSSHIIYLSNLRRPNEAEGTRQQLKVVAVGLNGQRSKPLFTFFDWGIEATDTTLPAEEPVNIMTEAEVFSYINPASTESPENLLTGTINNTSDKWYSSERSESVSVRFGYPRKVVRWVVEHAGAGGESADNGLMNTKDFNLEYKDLNTGQWKIAVKKRDVNEHVTDVSLEGAVTAQEWRLHILTADNGSPWGGIRIYNWKMYESINNESKNIPMATARAVHIKENLFSVVFSNGIEESTVYLYSDKEAKKILATGQVDSNGLVIFHRVKMKQASGILYYRSSQPDMALSPILAMPYQISDNAVEKVCLESDDTIEVNQLNPLNLSEHYLKLDYTDGTVNRISLDNVLVEVDAYDENQRGEQTLGVKFAGIESELPLSIDNQPINFESKEIQSITLGEAPQTSYFKGETLDLSDVLVTIVYTDGTRFNAPLTDTRMFQVSPFNEHEAGVQLLTITHRGFSTSLEVTVKEETVNFQRLDQLIGKVEAAMQQESTADKKDKEKVTQFLKAATALKLKDGATQSEVDQLVADNFSLG